MIIYLIIMEFEPDRNGNPDTFENWNPNFRLWRRQASLCLLLLRVKSAYKFCIVYSPLISTGDGQSSELDANLFSM